MLGFTGTLGFWRMAAGVLAVAVIAFGAKVCLDLGLVWRCPLLAMVGVPCPSCGSTRAFAALAALDFLHAVRFNPLIVLGLFFLPFVLEVKNWPRWVHRHGWVIFSTMVALNWVYLFLFLPR